MAELGANVQRPLLASTLTKNPDYPDTKYVDDLIGPDTVNTMPEATMDAFEDHGTLARTLEKDWTPPLESSGNWPAPALTLITHQAE